MIEPAASKSNHVVQHAGLMQSTGVYNSTDLTLRTREGDTVTISTSKQLAYSESAKYSRFEDGSSVEEFSTTSLAASQYSMAVQGDLNKEELSAIEQLVQKISTASQSFFNQSDFNIEKTSESIAESMGVLDQVALKLEQTIVKTVSSQYYNEKGLDPVKNAEADSTDPKSLNIRDVAALVQSVLESLLRQQKIEPSDNNFISHLLSDLTGGITSSLLNPNTPAL